MITLSEFIKKDLTNDVGNFEIMVILYTPDRNFYISTREQYFNEINENDEEEVFFEDLDLRISALQESLNFKTKKVKLSGTTITLSNHIENGLRFTDKVKFGILNSTIKVYLKTGSCRSIADCTLIATLKITRFDQDSEKVTMQCDEYLSEALYTELPKKDYTLYTDTHMTGFINGSTHEVYNGERIPILYGHLKKAPAITYILNDSEKIYVLPDRAMLDDPSGVAGIKQMHHLDNYTYGDGTGRETTNVVDQDTLTIGLGGGGARVYMISPKQANGRLRDIFWERQFDIHNNYVEFYTDESYKASPYINQGALMVGEISRLKKATNYLNAYSVHTSQAPLNDDNPFTNQFKRYPLGNILNDGLQGVLDYPDYLDLFSKKSVMWGSAFNGAHDLPLSKRVVGGVEVTEFMGGEAETNHYRVSSPCVVFEFEDMKSDADVYVDPRGRETPTDFNLIGFIGAKMRENDNSDFWSLTFCFYPGKADFIYGEETDDEGVEGGTDGGWQAHTPLGFVSQVLNGSLNDSGTDGSGHGGLLAAHNLEGHCDSINAVCPNMIRFEGSGNLPPNANVEDYRNPFNVPDNHTQDNEINQWRNRGDWIQTYPMHDIRSLLLNVNPAGGQENNDSPSTFEIDINFLAEFSGMLLRRTWYQDEALNKKFYLNAKGKYELYNTSNNRIWRVEGILLQYYSHNYTAPGQYPSHRMEEDKVLAYLLDYLGNEKLRYKFLDFQRAEIMLKFTNNQEGNLSDPEEMIDEVDYIFDLEINNMYDGHTGVVVSHKILLNGNLWRESNNTGEFTDYIGSVADHWAKDVRLVYARKVLSADGQIVRVEELEEVSEFTDAINDDDQEGNSGNIGFDSRLVVHVDNEKIYQDPKKLITRPQAVIKDLLSREFSATDLISKNVDDEFYNINFSIDKAERTTDILQKISQNTNFFYRTNLSTAKPAIVGIKNIYTSSNVDKIIYVDYIESYKFSKTKIEDLATRCRVKYGYDYISEEYTKVTEDIFTYGELRERYKLYYGLDDNQFDGDDFLLEHEAPYIQDEVTALFLRDHLYELHKNQHVIVDFTINLSIGVALEVGDVLGFDALDQMDTAYGSKYGYFFSPYGMNLTEPTRVPYSDADYDGQQVAYPFFMITEIRKTMTNISIKAIQLHSLYPYGGIDLWTDALLGDIDLNESPYEISDYELLRSYLNGGVSLNDDQLLNADINQDGIVDQLDLVAMLPEATILGDLNGDGVVNEDDVEIMQLYIDDYEANPLNLQQIANGDFNGDGQITDIDRVALDNYIDSLAPPPFEDYAGGLIIDTEVTGGFGVFLLSYDSSEEEIIIEILESITIGYNILDDYMEGLESSEETLVETPVTFQPVLSGAYEGTTYYPWLSAAGNYQVKRIEHITTGVIQLYRYRFVLDANVETFEDGWNLQNLTIGDSIDPSNMNSLNLHMYGDPEPSVALPNFAVASTANHIIDGSTSLNDYSLSGFTVSGANYLRAQVQYNNVAVDSSHPFLNEGSTWLDVSNALSDPVSEYYIDPVSWANLGHSDPNYRFTFRFRYNEENYQGITWEEESQAGRDKAAPYIALDGTTWVPYHAYDLINVLGGFVVVFLWTSPAYGCQGYDTYGNPIISEYASGLKLTINVGQPDEQELDFSSTWSTNYENYILTRCICELELPSEYWLR